jgi:hypothetical protein
MTVLERSLRRVLPLMALTAVLASCGLMYPEEVRNIISQQQIRLLEESGLKVHSGLNPPDVEGSYRTTTLKATFDSTNIYPSVYAYYYRFYDQDDDRNSVRIDYNGGNGGDVANGEGAFLSGNGSRFSLFVEAEGVTNGIPYRQVSVYSGTITEQGIKDFQLGIILVEKDGDDNDVLLMPVEGRRVFVEEDGLAERVAWPYASIRGAAADVGDGLSPILGGR